MYEKDDNPILRAERYPPNDPMLKMPECDIVVLEAFKECGLSKSNGMGEDVIPWSEINAYSIATESELTAWEKRMVRRMSKEYLSFKSESTKWRSTKSPYEPELTEEDTLERAKMTQAMI